MIIGHAKQLSFLKKARKEENLGHAYLFCGPEKVGKRSIALEWIADMFKEDILSKPHPDLFLVEAGKKEIQISQIRELIRYFSLKPYVAPLKAAIINDAHLMNKEAQTALLKTLEEPKGKTILVLVSQEPKALFSTILSRVETIKFYPVKNQEIKDFLKKKSVSEKEIEDVAEICQGCPGKALDYINDSGSKEYFEKEAGALNKILNSNLSYRFECAKNISESSNNLGESLDVWLYFFRKMLLASLEKKDNNAVTKFKNAIKNIQKTKLLINTTNVNPRLALENLMLNI